MAGSCAGQVVAGSRGRSRLFPISCRLSRHLLSGQPSSVDSTSQQADSSKDELRSSQSETTRACLRLEAGESLRDGIRE
jgi:hypothetical protein